MSELNSSVPARQLFKITFVNTLLIFVYLF